MTAIAETHTPALDTTVHPLSARPLYQVQRRVTTTLQPLKASRHGQVVLGAVRPFTQRDVKILLELLAELEPSTRIE